MGVFRRNYCTKRGKRAQRWWLNYTVGGRQVFESSYSTSKRFAEKLLAIRQAEIAAGRFEILKRSPKLGDWSQQYLEQVAYANTRKRYAVSSRNLIRFFGEGIQLDNITTARINEFIKVRRNEEIKSATLNRDLRYLAQILKQAERNRYIGRSPFDLGKFFQPEMKDRRAPHILTELEEARLLAVSSPRLRLIITLGVDAGLRTGEMQAVRWKDVDIAAGTVQVRKSKTQSGIRVVPLSKRCKAEIEMWSALVGPEFSDWVFPHFQNRRHPLLRAGRKAWTNALKKASIPYFPIYNLRHTFASRMTAAGVSPLTIASLLGHSSSQIVPRYSVVLDQNRLDAINKLEAVRQASISRSASATTSRLQQ